MITESTPIRILNAGSIAVVRAQRGRWVAKVIGTNLAWRGNTSLAAAERAQQFTSQPNV